jgi:hypothetical protein
MSSEGLDASPWIITGGISDSDVRENSAVLVFPESTAEALFDKVRLASGAEFWCDLALEIGVCSEIDVPEGYPLFPGSESVCACMVPSELTSICVLTGIDSPFNSSFPKDVRISGMSVPPDNELPCVSALEDAESLRALLDVIEIC